MVFNLYKLINHQYNLEEELANTTDSSARNTLIFNYLKARDGEKESSVNLFDELPQDCRWINTERRLTQSDFVGKVIVLDFFTYCCINCMHILPDLESLEEKFEQSCGLVVVGIHSAKFNNEKIHGNLLNAIGRYDIKHPVVDDHKLTLWNKLQIYCWPTLLVIGPTGKVLFSVIGEGHKTKLFDYSEAVVNYYKPLLSSKNLPMQLYTRDSTVLRYPSKLSVSPTQKSVAIADSGHNRILIVDRTSGFVEFCIGGTDRNYVDGCFVTARFSSPQGLAWSSCGSFIYVADTDNHCIRRIDLRDKEVSTIAGNPPDDTKDGFEHTNMRSPWDVCIASTYSGVDDLLYVAVAGSHQIYELRRLDSVYGLNADNRGWMSHVLSGSGREGNRNNLYAVNVTFAQPSGVCFDKNSELLFVADSESSSIRSVDTRDGSTLPVVGGDRDPSNLFSYGDVDGRGIDVKLQHPLGVCWNTCHRCLYVADSYNHKIKIVEIKAKKCTTLEAELNVDEPAGLCLADDDETLLICDTNNHRVVVVNLVDKATSQMEIKFNDDELVRSFDSTDGQKSDSPLIDARFDRTIEHETVDVGRRDILELLINVIEDGNRSLNVNGPSGWSIHLNDVPFGLAGDRYGTIDGLSTLIRLLPLKDSNIEHGTIRCHYTVYVCDDATGCCSASTILHIIPIDVKNDDACDDGSVVTQTLDCELSIN